MDIKTSGSRGGAARFKAYFDRIAAILGHSGRADPMRAYCRALLLPGGRKSVEPMAARLESNRVRALHQSLHHLVAKAAWDDAAVLAEVRRQVIPCLARAGTLRYFTVNDLIVAKQGINSVGVAKQRANSSGVAENCQVSVSLWVSNEVASLPIAYRLFLPVAWTQDAARREAVGVPQAARFESKPAIALQQLREAAGSDASCGVVLAGAEYGEAAAFRAGLEALGLRYVLVVPAELEVWPAAGSARALALSLPGRAWRTMTVRDGGRTGVASRFTALRVRLRAEMVGAPPDAVKWLLIGWPADKGEPTRFWLSDLPATVPLRSLVWTATSVGRVAADCRELQQTIGLGHYEGRGWRGHHHHASLCIAAYGFLVAERCGFPPAQRYVPSLAAELPQSPGIRSRGLRRRPGLNVAS